MPADVGDGGALDLDAADADRPSTDRAPGRRAAQWPDAAPAWVRGPVGVLVAVAVAVVATGALSASSAAARVEERVTARTALLGLSVTGTDLVHLTGARDAGPVAAELYLTLVNRGGADLEVLVEGVSVPAGVGDGVERVTVPAGGERVAALPLEVDCTGVAEVPGVGLGDGRARPQEWVDVTVAGLGLDAEGGEPARLPLPDSSGDVGTRLADLCDSGFLSTAFAEALEVRTDGALLVRLANERDEPVQLVTQDAPGVDLLLDPPLTDGLPASTSVEVALSLRVDCARTGSLLDLPYDLRLAAYARQSEFALLDPSVLAAWSASRVTALCG